MTADWWAPAENDRVLISYPGNTPACAIPLTIEGVVWRVTQRLFIVAPLLERHHFTTHDLNTNIDPVRFDRKEGRDKANPNRFIQMRGGVTCVLIERARPSSEARPGPGPANSPLA